MLMIGVTAYELPTRAGGAGPTTSTLVGPKILSFMVKALYFQGSGRTNNCRIEALFKWSDQSCTPSAARASAGIRSLQTSIFVMELCQSPGDGLRTND